jgi:Bacteriophage Mu Gp45 spike protein
MHRATPLNTSIRAYTAGGARSVVDKVDDTKLMQEMGGNFMANETRDAIEAAQNYGFTSVVFDAEKGRTARSPPAPRPSWASWAATDPFLPAGRWMIAATASTSWRKATPRCFAGAATSSNFT